MNNRVAYRRRWVWADSCGTRKLSITWLIPSCRQPAGISTSEPLHLCHVTDFDETVMKVTRAITKGPGSTITS